MGDTRKKLTPADYVTSVWSGGATTQLAIAPEGASYADRAFLWRVSSATVELEESDFTALPDYHRLIATLRGDMVLTHKVGAPITLRPYQVHGFEGAEATHSRGRCTDFNLMLRRGEVDGTMEALRLPEKAGIWHPDPRAEELLLYCAEGTVSVETEKTELRTGESLYLHRDGAVLPKLTGQGVVMVCQMWRI